LNFLKKKFKIGKHELAAWQLYLGIIASILGIYQFFKTRNSSTATAEVPYTLNGTAGSGTDSSGSSTSSTNTPTNAAATYTDSANSDLLATFNNTLLSLNSNLLDVNAKVDSQNNIISSQNNTILGLNSSIADLKSNLVNTTSILNTIENNTAVAKASISVAAPVVPVDNHVTTAPVVVPDIKTNILTSIIPTDNVTNPPISVVSPGYNDAGVGVKLIENQLAVAPNVNTDRVVVQAIADLKAGTPVKSTSTWAAITSGIIAGTVVPSVIPAAAPKVTAVTPVPAVTVPPVVVAPVVDRSAEMRARFIAGGHIIEY